jgi:hypothetical protein
LEKQFDALLDDPQQDKKSALVKLNDIKQQVAERQKALGDKQALQEQLNKLKNVRTGPAKELASALAQGNLQEAQKVLRAMSEKLKNNQLNEIEKKKLATDLQAMAAEIQKMSERHEQEKQQLQDQIQQAIKNGDLDQAARLQEKLDQKQQQVQQQNQMNQIAQNLQKCADCIQQGSASDPQADKHSNPAEMPPSRAMQQAGESLEDLAQQIQRMQQQLEEMEALQDLEKLASDCKNCLNGPSDERSQSREQQDWQRGAGTGHGKREKAADDTGGFKSRVQGKLIEGETVVTGTADGNNLSGRSAAEVRRLVETPISVDFDPLENQQLPRYQRDHAQQYFEALRKNE